MKKILPALLLLAPMAVVANRPAKAPKLVVQIVVSSMRAGDLERYAAGFGTGGFQRLVQDGVVFEAGDYGCQQTLTPTSLATLATGTSASVHGVVGEQWYDYVDNKRVSLIDDRTVRNTETHGGQGAYSPLHLTAPTLGEALVGTMPDSRAVSIALDPLSAIAMAGREGRNFWMDTSNCHFSSSTCYMPTLPTWVERFNEEQVYLPGSTLWETLLAADKYRNKRRTVDILFRDAGERRRTSAGEAVERIESIAPYLSQYERLLYTPSGNTIVFAFAKTAVAQLSLGNREGTDLLNICLDSPEAVCEAYGPESIEAEDMYYRLDRDLTDFLTFIHAQVPHGEVLVVLTAAHGTSPSYDLERGYDRFNARQFEVILNGFLSARYGQGAWVLAYRNNSVWLNHNLIYEKKLSLGEMQEEVAAFALQFRGVSYALSAKALRGGVPDGYGRRMQRSFYPRRSGDVVIGLMPGWIEEHEHRRSSSGSMYGYDTRVPLIFYGAGMAPAKIGRVVPMVEVAPALSRMIGIESPAASEGDELRMEN